MTKKMMLLPLAVVWLGACATVPPTGPSVMVLPGTTRSFEQFRHDDVECRQYAYTRTNGQDAGTAAADAGVRSAVVGTAVGAAAGALLGGNRGARAGAGAGLIVGSAAGVNAADYSEYTAQERYDNNYIQCMYAMGHRVPVRGRFETQAVAPPPAPAASMPPPPPPPRR